MARQEPVNGAVPPSGGRTYRERAGECPRTFAGFVVNEATLTREPTAQAEASEWGGAPPAEGELTEEEPVNAHAHSRDS